MLPSWWQRIQRHAASTSFPSVTSLSNVMDPEIKNLVCENCWNTIFSADSFRRAWDGDGFKYVSPTWAEMEHSINFMCEWCDLVSENTEFYLSCMSKTGREPPAPDARFRLAVRFDGKGPGERLRLHLGVEDTWRPGYAVHTSADDNAALYIPSRDVLRDVDSPEGYTFTTKSIERCSRHERCPRPVLASLPTRVIDCLDPTKPKLFISNGVEAHYIALSYVWGEKQPHMTTTDNLPSYTERIDPSFIPRTIRDAIKVTHKLGIRYLWVDSFCIIQDLKEDKAREIARIRSIFKNAYVTIIAASASRVSEGFLGYRDILTAPNTLPFRCPDGSVGTMKLRALEMRHFNPVDSRAWCFEERIMSPRAIVYASYNLQYACQMTDITICGASSGPEFSLPNDVPRLHDRCFNDLAVGAAFDRDVDRLVINAWIKVISLYTERTLTESRDRLIAISGVADLFQRFWEDSEYIAGFWSHHFPACLLWHKKRPREYPRPAQYRAPSWSWAAVDGEIEYEVYAQGQAAYVELERVVELANANRPFGEVVGGRLKLKTIIRKATWDPLESELFEVGGPTDRSDPLATAESIVNYEEGRSERGEIGWVTADAKEEVSGSMCEIFLAVLTSTGACLLGIVVVPVADHDGTIDNKHAKHRSVAAGVYRRVGNFAVRYFNREEWLATPPQSIDII